jgi:hypothetical protein
VVTAFESVFDETPFVERKAAVRAAIFESDDRAVNFSEENHGLVQQDTAQWTPFDFVRPSRDIPAISWKHQKLPLPLSPLRVRG